MTLNARELATVLAALRFWQRRCLNGPTVLTGCLEYDIVTDSGTLDPLNVEEIDELCERINVEEKPLKKHTRDMHEMLVEEKGLLREWADALDGRAGPLNRPDTDKLRFRADEINRLIEKGLPKRFRKEVKK